MEDSIWSLSRDEPLSFHLEEAAMDLPRFDGFHIIGNPPPDCASVHGYELFSFPDTTMQHTNAFPSHHDHSEKTDAAQLPCRYYGISVDKVYSFNHALCETSDWACPNDELLNGQLGPNFDYPRSIFESNDFGRHVLPQKYHNAEYRDEFDHEHTYCNRQEESPQCHDLDFSGFNVQPIKPFSPPKKKPTKRSYKKARVTKTGAAKAKIQKENNRTPANLVGRCMKEPRRPTEDQISQAKNNRLRKALHSWYDRLNELVEFKEKSGHTEVPQKYAPNHSLGIWVNKQRMEYKKFKESKISSMTEWKIKELEEVGFTWGKPKGQTAWENSFMLLKEYKDSHGDCKVPTKYKQNRELGRWVSTQRQRYKDYKKGVKMSISQEEFERRIRRLEDIGFDWCLLKQPASLND